MTVRTIPATRTTVQVVYTEDPDVTARDAADRGWIPRDTADVRAGADVISVRPLALDERSAVADVGGLRVVSQERMLAYCRHGIAAANGRTTADEITAWLSQVDDDVIWLLGSYIQSITAARDPQIMQRAVLKRAPGEDAAAEAQKS